MSDFTQQSIERILEHREEVRIFRDPEDGYWFVNAVSFEPNDRNKVMEGSARQTYGTALWSALSMMEGTLAEDYDSFRNEAQDYSNPKAEDFDPKAAQDAGY